MKSFFRYCNLSASFVIFSSLVIGGAVLKQAIADSSSSDAPTVGSGEVPSSARASHDSDTPTSPPPSGGGDVCAFKLRVIEGFADNPRRHDYRPDGQGYWGFNESFGVDGMPQFQSQRASESQCLVDLMNDIRRWRDDRVAYEGRLKYVDDAVSAASMSAFSGGPITWNESMNVQNSNNMICEKFYNNDRDYFGHGFRSNEEMTRWHGNCGNAVYFLDEECKPVSRDNVTAECKSISDDVNSTWYLSTPISLAFGDVQKLDNNLSIVDFSLDASQPGKSWLWKASEEFPLLAYDPEHRGVISRAEQLFGQWTFGGKKLASLAERSAFELGGPWNNGFEALGSLDGNGDNKISGSELEPLALWFDKNRDGVSQPGEVKPVSEVGITALYYQVDRTDKATGNLYANVGYERIINGRVERGIAVDWSTKGADTPMDLINQELATSKVEISASTLKERASRVDSLSKPAEPKQSKEAAINSDVPSLLGIWEWRFNDRNFKNARNTPSGYLHFFRDENSYILGSSIVELPSLGSKKGSAIRVTQMTGRRGLDTTGRPMISLKVDPGNAKTLESSAKLSTDGKTLDGETVATGTANGATRTLKYSWIAKRITK